MLNDAWMSPQQFVVVREYSRDMNEPAPEKCEERWNRGKDLIVSSETGADQDRRCGGRKSVRWVQQEIDPDSFA
jgi:hypothetical protein